MVNVFSNTKGFLAEDPFNPGNILEGYIAVNKSNYGSMVITSINGEETEQIIHTTPKINYPFDRNGKWILPPVVYIEAYDKLDGTNIFMYTYTYHGEVYITYKTRLMPFVENSYFGNFYDMWVQMLRKYPNIPELWEHNYLDGYSFELYGSLNKHLIQYDTPLDTAMLFGMKGKDIIPISSIIENKRIGVPCVQSIDVAWKGSEYEIAYKDAQSDMELELEKIDEETYTGPEGEIWYAFNEIGKVQMFKCKPETIESIHWENSSPLIHENSIRTTVYNAAEEGNIDYESVSRLLLEEFTPTKVIQSEIKIKKIIGEVRADLEMRRSVRESIDSLGIDLRTAELPQVMRLIAYHYEGKDMRVVYNTARQMKEVMV